VTRTYLILLAQSYDRDKIISFFEENNYTSHWFYSLPYSFFVRSKLDANQLSGLIAKHFGQDRHFVTEVDSNYHGALPKEHWGGFKVP